MELKYNKKYKYKQLCEVLNLPTLSASKQKQQIQNLSKFYEIHKTQDNLYIIKRKYNEIEVIENIKYHKYKNYIEPMIYTILSQSNNNVIRMDMHELMEFLGIVNKDYHYAKYHPIECNLVIRGSTFNGLKIFSRESEPLLKKIIIDVLKDMQKKCLIKINMIPMFAKKYKNADDGKIYTKIWQADKEKDIPQLLEAERKALKYFKLEYWNDLQYFQFGEAKDIVANELNIDYFYYEYEIILNQKGLRELITENYIELKKALNKHIQDKTKKSQQGELKLLPNQEKDLYVEYLINTETDYRLRYNKND